MKKIVVSIMVILLVFATSLAVFAHSGRTDASGGHRDNKNASGLGYYHYHCGGHPAHLHSNGVCPYSAGASSSTSSTEESVVYIRDIADEPEKTVVPKVEYNAEEAKKNNAEIKEYFQRFYSNEMFVISIAHLSEKSASVKISYKTDLSGLDSNSLVFYNYDKDANKYSKIESPGYSYADGSLSFETSSNKGFVIIMDKEFVKK